LVSVLLSLTDQGPDDDSRREQLHPGRQTARAVPAVYAVGGEELATTRPRQSEHVLEVGRRRHCPANHRRVERPPRKREQTEQGEAGTDLEPARGDVPVRQPVAREVQKWTDRERAETRARGGTARRAGGDVERDDHRVRVAALQLLGRRLTRHLEGERVSLGSTNPDLGAGGRRQIL
jgi:hypothetical protein